MLDLRGILALGFLPGLCEASLVMGLSRYLLEVSWAWGLMAGFVHAAVSPAVVVPAAIMLEEKSLGSKAGVPTRLLCATCIEVVAAIVGFNVCFRIAVSRLDPAFTDDRPAWLQTWMPVLEILGGLLGGGLAGVLLSLAMPGCPGWGAAGSRGPKPGGDGTSLTNGRESAGGSGGREADPGADAGYGVAFWLLLGCGTLAVSYLKSVGFAGGGSLVCVMIAIVCGTFWEEDKKGKGVVVARLNLCWVFVQRALFAAMGAGLDLWSVQAGKMLVLITPTAQRGKSVATPSWLIAWADGPRARGSRAPPTCAAHPTSRPLRLWRSAACVFAAEAGYALALLGAGVAVRMLAALVVSSPAITGRPLAATEQAFLAVAWLPKATVQAALAGVAFG